MTTPPGPRQIWTDVVNGTTYRLVDVGSGSEPRFILEGRGANASLGEPTWQTYNLPLADVLERALAALLPPTA